MKLAIEGLCWLASVAAAVTTVMASVAPRMNESEAPTAREERRALTVIDADTLEDANEIVVRQNLFRPSRSPSDVEFGAPEPTADAAPAPARPRLVLSGIVGGPPWAALIDGLPGKEGTTLVQLGDTLSGLRVQSVTARGVVVIGMDTTWTLTIDRESH